MFQVLVWYVTIKSIGGSNGTISNVRGVDAHGFKRYNIAI